MRVLCCNPVFFEYRLPFYEEMARLLDGGFYVMYSPVRYKMCGKASFCQEIKSRLGEHAIELTTDHLFDTNAMQWDVMPDIERGKRIPLTWGVMRAIGRVKPDVLITEGYFQWTPMVLLYGLIHHVPVFMEYERTCWTERNAGRLKIAQRKLFNRAFAGFLVNGSETRRYLLSLGVPEQKIHVGGMSADSVRLKRMVVEYRERQPERGPGLHFLFTGAIAERKGVIPLLKAWEQHVQRHPDDRLTLVGDGNQMEQCREWERRFPSVHLTGRVPYERMGGYYAQADVYILPTLEDNWSLVIPEAMACGLPVATSIYNGCHPELVHDGENGFTFDPLQTASIVEVLDKFHHVDLKKMGEASIRLEEPFNAARSARRVYDAIRHV